MSGHDAHDSQHAHGQHGGQHKDASHSSHEPHDETSSDDFPADEPRSPGWLPLLGGALFLGGIFAFELMGSDAKTADQVAKDAATAIPTAAAPAAPPAAQPVRRPAGMNPPSAIMPLNHPQLPIGAGK